MTQPDPLCVVYAKMAKELLYNKDLNRFLAVIKEPRFNRECGNTLLKDLILKDTAYYSNNIDKVDLISSGLKILLSENKVNFMSMYGENRREFYFLSLSDRCGLNIYPQHLELILDHLIEHKIFILALGKELIDSIPHKEINDNLNRKIKAYYAHSKKDEYVLEIVDTIGSFSFVEAKDREIGKKIKIPEIFTDVNKLKHCHRLYFLGFGFDFFSVIGEKATTNKEGNSIYTKYQPYFEILPSVFNSPVYYFEHCCKLMNEKWDNLFSATELKLIHNSFINLHKSIYKY